MLTLPKQISSEFFKYSYSLGVDSFVVEVDNLQNKKSSLINLTGTFQTKNEFQMTPKLKIGPFPYGVGFYTPTTIKGYIFSNDKAETQINVLISPHSLIQVLFFLLPVFYIVMFFTTEDTRKDSTFYLLFITVFTLTPILLLLLSMFVKRLLLNRFIRHFNLKQIV